MKHNVTFLIADLDLFDTRPLTPVLRELRSAMYVLYTGRENLLTEAKLQRTTKGHFARLELSGEESLTPAQTTRRIVSCVVSLSPCAGCDGMHLVSGG